ncbi:MAG: gliding motility-associated C-terminal domain-containing protein, partial [Bacteroidota bacterium]
SSPSAGSIDGSNVFDATGLSTADNPVTVDVTYSVSGCTDVTTQLSLNILDAPILIINSTPVVCPEASIDLDDVALGFTVSPTGGSFSFSNPSAGIIDGLNVFDATGLSTANNPVTIDVTYDITGCTQASAQLTLNILDASNPLCGSGGTDCAAFSAIIPNVTRPTCENFNDGILSFDIQGGSGNYLVNMTDSQGNPFSTQAAVPTFMSLSPETYTYSITDVVTGIICDDGRSITVNVLSTVDGEIGSTEDVVCFGETGSVTLTNITPPLAQYFYSIDGGLNWFELPGDNRITGLSAGTTSVRLGDADGDPCPAIIDVTINNLNTEITASFTSISDASCAGNDGSVSFTNIQGGDTSAPYTFTLDGSPFTLPGDGVITGLAGGSHELAITDASGCIDINNFDVIQPGLVTLDFLTPVDPSCVNPTGQDGRIEGQISTSFLPGTFEINITNDTGYDTTFNALPNGFFATRNELTQGSYDVTITSASDGACPNVFSSMINGGPFPITFESARLVCISSSNPSARSIILEGLQVDYSEPFEVTVINEQTAVERVLDQEEVSQALQQGIFGGSILNESGIYTISLTQTQSVCGTEQEFLLGDFIVSPQFTSVSVDTLSSSLPDRPTGALVINRFEGGLEPYRTSLVLIDPANPSQSFSSLNDLVGENNSGLSEIIYEGLPAGAYDVTIVDSLGCSPFNFNVGIPLNTDVFIPNVFTPNGDGVNDTFEIRNITGSGAGSTMLITNRWGKVVFSSDDYYFNNEGDNNFWDGGDEPDGVYFYTAEIEGETFKGWVEILRGQP